MDISVAGWIGALVGTMLGVINYAIIIAVVEGRLRAQDRSRMRDEREAFEQKLSAIRRTVLAIDIGICAAVGYWVGRVIGG